MSKESQVLAVLRTQPQALTMQLCLWSWKPGGSDTGLEILIILK